MDGSPVFVVKDLCAVLGYRDPTNAVTAVDPDEKGTATVSTPGGPQRVLVVTESGLYTLVVKSRRPEAKAFRKWVTSEVLPAIRKTGGYMTPEVAQAAVDDPAVFMAKALVIANETLARVKAQAVGMDPDLPQDTAIRTLAQELGIKLTHGMKVRWGHAAAGASVMVGRPKVRESVQYVNAKGVTCHSHTRLFPREVLLRAARSLGLLPASAD